MKKIKRILLGLSIIGLSACSSTHTPPCDPNQADLTKTQIGQLSQRKLHVPCRVEVHCVDAIKGDSTAFWKDHYYTYPLQEILTSSFKSAIYSAFDQPGSEVVDAFTVYVQVPESRFAYTGSGDSEYKLQIIVRFDEPGEKKITAFSLDQSFEGTITNYNAVPPVIYDASRTLAYRAIETIVKNPKVIKTVKRFEEK